MKTLKLIKSSGVIFVTAGIITVIAESIGVIKVSALGVNFSLLPMLYAVIIGVLVTPDLIGNISDHWVIYLIMTRLKKPET
ncbi:DUF3100 domain-containing protein [Escherichia coli]|uniref:DUF3100 domain-containing protein n=1 Tax=Escherichia coli TaxID=562 RepID=UPI000AEBCD9F|nr:DUF3100 domain-containing protein [Escherichia coli]